MRLAIRLFTAAKVAIHFAIRRPKDTVIILLLILLALSGWRFNREMRHAQELAAKIEGWLPDTKQVVTVYRDRVITRWRDGTKIFYQDRYLPPEGKIELSTKDNKPETSSEIRIKDRGFTKRLGGGLVYSGKALPMIDFKWAYWRRYSLTAGLSAQYGGLAVSRHIDDFFPFENLEALCFGGFDWRGNPRFGIGLRINF